MYDPLENGDDKFVGVGDDLGDGSVHTEVETSLNLELLDFVPNVLDHFVQLVKVLFMKLDNVYKKIWTETELKFVRLSENGIDEYGLLCL
jgi:hypothetical protein